MRSQHSGNPKALTKQKELVLYQQLQQAAVEFEYQKYIPFAGCGLNPDGAYETKHAFVDFVIAKPWGYILLECDEEQHRDVVVQRRCSTGVLTQKQTLIAIPQSTLVQDFHFPGKKIWRKIFNHVPREAPK